MAKVRPKYGGERLLCSKKQFTAAFKKAIRDLTSDMGYSSINRVPKHMRVALRSHATSLASVRCYGIGHRHRGGR